jgi:hypothetical protein
MPSAGRELDSLDTLTDPTICAEGHVRVYQAAFSNADILLWDTEALRGLGLID